MRKKTICSGFDALCRGGSSSAGVAGEQDGGGGGHSRDARALRALSIPRWSRKRCRRRVAMTTTTTVGARDEEKIQKSFTSSRCRSQITGN